MELELEEEDVVFLSSNMWKEGSMNLKKNIPIFSLKPVYTTITYSTYVTPEGISRSSRHG